MVIKKSLVGLLAISLFLIACSTVKVQIPVTRPAEVNLKGKTDLIINPIEGHGGELIGDYLKEKAGASNRFKLIDRSHLDQILRELAISNSDLSSIEGQKKLGKIMPGSILINGRVDAYGVSDNVKYKNIKCTKYDSNGKGYESSCTQWKREVNCTVRASFNIIDVETAQNLKCKIVPCKTYIERFAIDEQPVSVDHDALLQKYSDYVAAEFLKTIAPWQEMVTAKFIKDSDVPMLERGISFATQGLWDEAIAEFQKGSVFVDRSPDINPKVAAKAHWDLGLAYEYTSKFEEAAKEIKKAFDLSGDEDYLSELGNLKKMQSDHKNLQEQEKDNPLQS